MKSILFASALGVVLLASGCRTHPDLNSDLQTRKAMREAQARQEMAPNWVGVGSQNTPQVPDAPPRPPSPPSETSQWSVPPDMKEKNGTDWAKTTLPLSVGDKDYTVEKSWTPVYFEYDKSVLSANEQQKLQSLAEYLVANTGFHLIIEGHCDDRGGEEYNRSLGERRALAAKEYLTARKVAAARIRTVSFGEDRPAVMGTDDASRSQNRRDELVIITLNRP